MRWVMPLVAVVLAGCASDRPAPKPGDLIQLTGDGFLARDPGAVERRVRWEDAGQGKPADDRKPFDDPLHEIATLGPGTILRVLAIAPGVLKVIVVKDVREPGFIALEKLRASGRGIGDIDPSDYRDLVGHVSGRTGVVIVPPGSPDVQALSPRAVGSP